MNEPIGGIILAGGQSKRMGTNKALLRTEPDGPTMIEKALAALREITLEVLLVTNQPHEYEWLGLPMVGDNYKVGASLAGLEAGLTASKYQYNVVVACDMPYINRNFCVIWSGGSVIMRRSFRLTPKDKSKRFVQFMPVAV